MKKSLLKGVSLLLLVPALLSGCGNKSNNNQTDEVKTQTTSLDPSKDKTPSGAEKTQKDASTEAPSTPVDLEKVKPNEAGSVMVVMFHNFIEAYKSGDKEYTTTFEDFRKLLATLYEKDYRLVSMSDYLNNNISVPAGKIPMVFTFDDGTSGQFNLIEENGKLVTNPKSAVGVMEEFNKQHPDFGLKGSLYVNLGNPTFEGKGTIAERLKYLIDEGFEIGNHTLTHISLPSVKSADKIMEEVGGNQKKMLEIIPGYNFESLALPFGGASKDLQKYVVSGEYQGVKYENHGLMLVGANPAPPSTNKKFNPVAIPRVRASGIKLVDCDLTWWLSKSSRNDQYVSDGNPNTITVPKAKESLVDTTKLKDKKLVTY